jgi:hypothetical protein
LKIDGTHHQADVDLCPIGEVFHGEHFSIQAKIDKAEITNKSVTAKW